jgi:competence protein ComEA
MLSVNTKKGLFLLLGLIVVVAILPRIFLKDEIPQIEITKISEGHLSQLDKRKTDVRSIVKKRPGKRFKTPVSRFYPEKYSINEWMDLGLSRKQSEVVCRMVKNGVRSESYLKKIYVIPQELFELIKDSVIYQSAGATETISSKEKAVSKRIEINSATKEELITLPGVGEYIAGRIIDYRSKLKGYSIPEQLMELKKIDLTLYNKLEPHISVDGSLINKININSATSEELAAHPYISWNVANSIVKIREQKGGYRNLEEIKSSVLIDEELFTKLKPYISL